ncbi:MAG: hypothetical protein J7K31_00475 [Candidatus Aenigmarchaeota archaeon]|nr:hypothetical protein [Candidatus Aenigmarchaeota archaeon]RLJ04155.1 MAG: hypothetical protein DRP08_02355 [Candidatus Aenigmarchaeota archaeon]
MPRLSRSYDLTHNSEHFAGKKGQWFIISAIVISSAFLVISMLFKGYYLIDTSSSATIDEDYYFENIQSDLNNVIDSSDCSNVTKNLNKFIEFAREEMGKKGKYLDVNYTISCPTIFLTASLRSNQMTIQDSWAHSVS